MIFKRVSSLNSTVLDNKNVENPTLSYQDKGMLWFLLSRPDGWKPDRRELVEAGTDGEGTVKTILSSLEKAKHLYRGQIRSEDNTRFEWLIAVFEDPRDYDKFCKKHGQPVKFMSQSSSIGQVSTDRTSTNSETAIKFEKVVEKKPRRRVKKGQSEISDDFVISDKIKDWKLKEFPELTDSDLEKRRIVFIDIWKGRGETKANWDATFRNHIRAYMENRTNEKQTGKKSNATSLYNRITSK